MTIPGISGIDGAAEGDGRGAAAGGEGPADGDGIGAGGRETAGVREGTGPGCGAALIPGIGGMGFAAGAGWLGPMLIPGIVMAMFCMADMRFVSESTRNCAEVTTRSPSASPETTG